MSSFDALGLRAEILLSLKEIGFTTPTPVQEQAIPLLLKTEKDVVALAQTGTTTGRATPPSNNWWTIMK